MDQRANRLAHYLEGVGIGPGDHVGLQLANGTEYIEAMLACFKIRAAAHQRQLSLRGGRTRVPLQGRGAGGPDLPQSIRAGGDRRPRLQFPMCVPCSRSPTAAGSSGIAVDYEAALETAPSEHGGSRRGGPTISTASTPGGRRGCPRGCSGATTTSSSPPWVVATHFRSATTSPLPRSLPSGSCVLGSTALAIPPFMHAAGHWLAFSTMFGGGKVVTLEGGVFDPSDVWRLVDVEEVNVIVVVGDAMARPLLDVLAADPDRYDLSSLMAVGSGGAVLSPSTKAQLARLLPGRVVADRFGSSETGQVGGEAPAGDPYGPPRLRVDERTDVFDADLRSGPARARASIGHLARGGHVPIGYLGDAAKSATTFVEHDGQRWALPGDLATVEADGTITVLGRGSLCINTGGRRSFPTRWRRH